jgi:hypothetical protein
MFTARSPSLSSLCELQKILEFFPLSYSPLYPGLEPEMMLFWETKLNNANIGRQVVFLLLLIKVEPKLEKS